MNTESFENDDYARGYKDAMYGLLTLPRHFGTNIEISDAPDTSVRIRLSNNYHMITEKLVDMHMLQEMPIEEVVRYCIIYPYMEITESTIEDRFKMRKGE